MPSFHLRRPLLIVFWPLTALILWFDGRVFNGEMARGQWLSNVVTPLFLIGVMSQLRPRQALVLALFVPLSALGEGLFSLVFGLYRYRLETVPLYVPFGHAILLGMAWLMVEETWVARRERTVVIALALFHGGLIFGALLLFRDVLSLLWGVMFWFVWTRHKRRGVFLVVGVLVLYIEILGTAFGCWKWRPLAFGLVPTWNPPVGAFACYILGELGAIRAARIVAPILKPQWSRLGWQREIPESVTRSQNVI